MNNLVDITHTVKASEANGRKLFRDLDTGRMIWDETVPATESETPVPVEEVEPKKSKRKPAMQD